MTEFEDFIKVLEAITDVTEYQNRLKEMKKDELYFYTKLRGLKNCSSLNKTNLISRLIEARFPRKPNSLSSLDFNETMGIKDKLPRK